MFKDLKNKVAILTGGSGFLGMQFAEVLAEAGCIVFNLDIKKNINFEKKIKNKRLKIHFIKCNIADVRQLKKSKNIIIKAYKRIDFLINNACKDYKVKKGNLNKLKLENFSEKIWDTDLNVGLKGTLLCTKIFGKEMINAKKGNIVNISSDLGIISPNQEIYLNKGKRFSLKPVTYSVIKHGIIGITKYTAVNWAPYNIRCNALCPGGMENNQNKYFLTNIKKLIPLKRMGRFNEYNLSLLYLLSDASSYMNGHSLILDGGRSIW